MRKRCLSLEKTESEKMWLWPCIAVYNEINKYLLLCVFCELNGMCDVKILSSIIISVCISKINTRPPFAPCPPRPLSTTLYCFVFSDTFLCTCTYTNQFFLNYYLLLLNNFTLYIHTYIHAEYSKQIIVIVII